MTDDRGLLRDLREAGYALYCWVLFLVVVSMALLLLLVIPSPDWRRRLVRVAAGTLRVLTGTRMTVIGAEKFPLKELCVLVANHTSWLDAPLLTSWLPDNFDFVAGEVFTRQRVVGLFLRRAGVELIKSRQPGPRSTTARLGQMLATRSVVVFPEGGLGESIGLRRFRMGAFVAAAESGRPIVPVAIVGSRPMLSPGQRFIRRGSVRFVIGEPIEPEGSDWSAALDLRQRARSVIVALCGEPDLTI